jgi:hypothetical protein
MPLLVLPAWSRMREVSLPKGCGACLARGDFAAHGPVPRARLFEPMPRGWPLAAISRQWRRGDAGTSAWLRADPAWLRADVGDVRLLAHGPALTVSPAEAEALARTLAPVFGDAGLPFDWPADAANAAQAWLRLPEGAPCPVFSEPAEALGDDLLAHLPAGRDAARWRALFNEVQVLLHQHPVNAERARRGSAPINGLWFWGAGRLPHDIQGHAARLYADDPEWQALQHVAGGESSPCPGAWPDRVEAGDVFDLRASRDADALVAAWLAPACAALAHRRLAALQLLFDDGAEITLRASQRWRLWRRPWSRLADGG